MGSSAYVVRVMVTMRVRLSDKLNVVNGISNRSSSSRRVKSWAFSAQKSREKVTATGSDSTS
jgi:hypothetical protein